MKIPISLTVLNGMPDVAWQNLSPLLLDEDIALTPVQNVAAYCWRYYVAVYNHGISGFLTRYREDDPQRFASVFDALGMEKIAEELAQAAQGEDQADDALDDWFETYAPAWYQAVQAYVMENADAFFEIVDEEYTLVPYRLNVTLSAIMASVVFGFAVLIALTQTLVNYPLFFLLSFAIASPLLAVLAYGLFWRVSVQGDVITIRRFLRPKRVLHIEELTKVEQKWDRLVLYARGRRALVVRRAVGYYGMFATQLGLAGKIEQADMNHITVWQHKSTLVAMFLWPAAPAVFLGQSLARKANPAGIYEIGILSALILIALLYVLLRPWRKIVVRIDSLTVVNMIGLEKAYPLSAVILRRGQNGEITLFAHDKKIAQLTDRHDGSGALLGRFRVDVP